VRAGSVGNSEPSLLATQGDILRRARAGSDLRIAGPAGLSATSASALDHDGSAAKFTSIRYGVTMKHKRLLTSVTAICLGFGLTMVAASPALADSCTLTIGPVHDNDVHRVTVVCASHTNQAFGLYGQDTLFDEFRGGPFVSGDGFPGSLLNEDDSFLDREDEIYAITTNGTRTNTVTGRF
jgi:hypothetical protein